MGTIFGQHARFKITSVTGHIFCRDFPPKYADWYQCDPIELFDALTLKREVPPAYQASPDNNLVSHLKKEAEGCSYLVLWLDNDKEGENICFEVVDITSAHLLKLNGQQIFRAKFSSIARRDIIHAFESLAEGPNKNESLAVDARQIIDLKVGVAFSRFQSLYLKKKFQNLNQKMITFGPCQTPTLSFCVDRHNEILNFRPVTYYKIDCKFTFKVEEPWLLLWEKESTESKEEAETVKSQVAAAGSLQVYSISRKENIRQRPEGVNTVQLLKHCSSNLGLGPNDAMNIAEKLYLGGYITYPRTETTVYSPNFDFSSLLGMFTKSSSLYAEFANRLLHYGYSVQKAGLDAGDHPPITPTHKIPPKGFLPGHEGKVYDFICRQFFATLFGDATYVKTKIIFESAGYLFSLSGSAVIDPGFTEVLPWVKISNRIIPHFEKGEKFPLLEVEIKETQTTAPSYLSESELISLMEKNGIGTDASMATHINNICERNFVEIISRARRLKPTPLGNALIQGYREIDPELISAELRSNIEKNVELIARGKKDLDSVLSSVLGIFKQKYEYFRQNITKLDMIFLQVYGTFMDSLKKGVPFNACGRCSQKMILVEDFNKTYCKICKITLNLPRDATYSLEGMDRCPLDGYQVINYYILREGYEVNLRCCPHCYHKSPHPDISQRLICSQCPHEPCPVSYMNNLVCLCPKCRSGYLILNRPINSSFYLSCNQNRCNHILVAIQTAQEVKRSKSKCTSCSAFKLMVIFIYQVYLTNPIDFTEVCVFCDDRFSPYIYEPHPMAKLKTDRKENNPGLHPKGSEFPTEGTTEPKIAPGASHQGRYFERKASHLHPPHVLGPDPFLRKENKNKMNQSVKQNKAIKNNSDTGGLFGHGKGPSNLSNTMLARSEEDFSSMYTSYQTRLEDPSIQGGSLVKPQQVLSRLTYGSFPSNTFEGFALEEGDDTFGRDRGQMQMNSKEKQEHGSTLYHKLQQSHSLPQEKPLNSQQEHSALAKGAENYLTSAYEFS